MPQPDASFFAAQLDEMTRAVVADQRVNSTDLRRILRFITKVTQVVNAAFGHIYPVLVEISFLQDKDLNTDKTDELQKELMLLSSRDYYHNVALICGQLEQLSYQFDAQISPLVNTLDDAAKEKFKELFMLLEYREGYILQTVQNISYELSHLLNNANTNGAVKEAKTFAREKATEINRAQQELQRLSNAILGNAGKEGFLELTETDRLHLKHTIMNTINYTDNSISTGNINGNQVAIGNNINQHHEQNSSGLSAQEVAALIDELLKDIQSENIPDEVKTKVKSQLEVSKTELSEKEPDKDYIGKNIQKVADALKKSNAVITEGTEIGKKLISIGKWIGLAASVIL